MPKLTDEQVGAQLSDLQNERAELARTSTPEDAREAAEGAAERAKLVLSARTPTYAAGGNLLPEQMVDLLGQFILSQSAYVDWLAGEIPTGELTRAQKAKQLDALDAQIAELRTESNKRRIAAAKAEAEARVKDEIAALEESLTVTNV